MSEPSTGPSPAGVPAAPNAALVRGTLTRADPDPDGGARWEIAVSRAEPVAGLPNWAATAVGGPLSVTVPAGRLEAGADGPRPGDTVELRVEYRGDERGGLYLATGDPPRRL